ncbi:unnamed protein product [Caenorhabditis sp. 36 PRJEB53466]|nr:unnamed protein product [Caenorhabditis sp. 36 PRJEB53466]
MAGGLFCPDTVTDETLQNIVEGFATTGRAYLRNYAAQNELVKRMINSDRFLIAFARHTQMTASLPSPAWLEKQRKDGGFRNGELTHRFNLSDIVFNKTRHGFREVDLQFEPIAGIASSQNTGGCVSSAALRNIHVVENVNAPICRFDAQLFCQNWVLTLIRPRFVFRGLIACPSGDYGIARLMIEVGDNTDKRVTEELAIPFKEANCGQFVPFEVVSPEYDFPATLVFVHLMVFYVNQSEIVEPGMRIANCTVQCRLPEEPVALSNPFRHMLTADQFDQPHYSRNFDQLMVADAERLQTAPTDFFSVIDNARAVRLEETARAEREAEQMLAGNMLVDPPEDEILIAIRTAAEERDGEPSAKRRR